MDLLLTCSLFLRLIAYATGLDYYPDFDIRVGQTLDTATSYFVQTVPRLCNCRQLCLEDEICIAYRGEPYSFRWKCYLFRYGLTYQLLNEACADVQLAVKIAPGSRLEVDGNYYYVTPDYISHDEAKVVCSSGLGFFLALPKTIASYTIASNYSMQVGQVLVDLQRKRGGQVVFGDGTPYNETEIGSKIDITESTYYLFWSMLSTNFLIDPNFLETFSFHKTIALCQGNPLGI